MFHTTVGPKNNADYPPKWQVDKRHCQSQSDHLVGAEVLSLPRCSGHFRSTREPFLPPVLTAAFGSAASFGSFTRHAASVLPADRAAGPRVPLTSCFVAAFFQPNLKPGCSTDREPSSARPLLTSPRLPLCLFVSWLQTGVAAHSDLKILFQSWSLWVTLADLFTLHG